MCWSPVYWSVLTFILDLWKFKSQFSQSIVVFTRLLAALGKCAQWVCCRIYCLHPSHPVSARSLHSVDTRAGTTSDRHSGTNWNLQQTPILLHLWTPFVEVWYLWTARCLTEAVLFSQPVGLMERNRTLTLGMFVQTENLQRKEKWKKKPHQPHKHLCSSKTLQCNVSYRALKKVPSKCNISAKGRFDKVNVVLRNIAL